TPFERVRRQRREPELEATRLALHQLEHLTEPQPRARLPPRHAHQLRIEQLDRPEPLGHIPAAPHPWMLAQDCSNVEPKTHDRAIFKVFGVMLDTARVRSKHDARCCRAYASRCAYALHSSARTRRAPHSLHLRTRCASP